MTTHIAILHVDSIPAADFSDFVQTISSERLKLDIESRKSGQIYAGLEWLIPTAVVVYLGKSYFDGFLKEMGKDHYNLLKAGLKALRKKLFGPDSLQMTALSSAGKTKPSQPYSLVYSIMAEGYGHLRFKLLVPRHASEYEYDEIFNAFLAFLEAYHSPKADFAASFEAPVASGGIVLLAFDQETKTLEIIDPCSGQKNELKPFVGQTPPATPL